MSIILPSEIDCLVPAGAWVEVVTHPTGPSYAFAQETIAMHRFTFTLYCCFFAVFTVGWRAGRASNGRVFGRLPTARFWLSETKQLPAPSNPRK